MRRATTKPIQIIISLIECYNTITELATLNPGIRRRYCLFNLVVARKRAAFLKEIVKIKK